jgi:hypothetical protein
MRKLIYVLLTLGLLASTPSSSSDNCSVREFYSIAYGVHDPTERHRSMIDWLTNRQYLCRSSDIVVIWNNLPEWAGTADSHLLRSLVIHSYKNAIARETQSK